MSDKFSVYYQSNDSLGNITECECKHVDADMAFKWFRHHTTNVSANVGWTARVIIVEDASDAIVAEWKFGHGLVWPKEDNDGR
jgi:hypothetical protein